MGKTKGGKGRGRGGGTHYAATSAEEIALRNERMEAFDKERLAKRKAKQEEAGTGPLKKDDEDDEIAFEDGGGEQFGEQFQSMDVSEKEYKPKGVAGIIETANPNAVKEVHGKIASLCAQ